MSSSVTHFDFKQGIPSQHCPKCDSDLFAQTNGSCATRDIAHQRESIDQALSKLDDLIDEGYSGHYQHVRVVVGGRLIKDETLRQLYFYEQEGFILSYTEEGHNSGAILIQIRNKFIN